MTEHSTDSRSRIFTFANILMALLFGSYLAAAVLIGSRGYGDTLDSYLMLRTWQTMLLDGVYQPSRFQGNIVPEFVIGFLACEFGSYGCNFASLSLSLAAAGLCVMILSRISTARRLIYASVLTVVVNPFWIICSSTPVDYMYPIALFLLGIWLLITEYSTFAALSFAVAAGARISYVPLGLTALLIAWYRETDRSRREQILSAVVTYLLTGGLFYLPVLISSRLTLKFLNAARPTSQGFKGLAIRFVYKGHELYGYAGTYLVAGVVGYYAYQHRKSRSRFTEKERLIWACALIVIVFHLALFLWIPAVVYYLLPILIAVAALLVLYHVDRRIIVAICLLEISVWFVKFDPVVLRHQSNAPCAPVVAVGAKISPHLASGILLPLFEGDMRGASCSMPLLRIAPTDFTAPLPPPLFADRDADSKQQRTGSAIFQ